jgi:hypothetical protein
VSRPVPPLVQDFVYSERDTILRAFPQGYHKLDKQVRDACLEKAMFTYAWGSVNA